MHAFRLESVSRSIAAVALVAALAACNTTGNTREAPAFAELIDRAEAERLRDTINRQQNLKGIVVRFQPERG